MRAAIIGAGIGGLCTAIGLARAGNGAVDRIAFFVFAAMQE